MTDATIALKKKMEKQSARREMIDNSKKFNQEDYNAYLKEHSKKEQE